MSKAKTNQARIAYSLRQMQNLASADLPVQAQAMGLKVDGDGNIKVRFLGHDYLVTNSDIRSLENRFTTVDTKSVLAHYITSKGTGELLPDFLPIARLTGIASGASAGASPSDNLAKPLGDKFGSDYETFKRAALQIGAKHLGLGQSGAQTFELDDLPKLPVRLEFFEADEEFDAEIKLLFNAASTRFVSYECLEILTMSVVVEILMVAGLISDPEDCEASFI
ncbi:MAG: DUF3786 domain-containing protein [Deltaproteobacteria bacterium]|jgi:hypothetical protein|nr:DUF3786 domain-containing protein [Deltaproteobacteria bacterium]